LHRLVLAGPIGRPAGLPDEGCLRRLAEKHLVCRGEQGWQITESGLLRHRSEILRA